ncbi:peptidase M24, structural domain-containing protein [Pisolithus sp. B1]|nr:peptidase M24, structural domain-containing protein [Pisolithus sp. B1]
MRHSRHSSLNDDESQVAHLDNGDIQVNIDVTVYLNGYHGGNSRTFLVGEALTLVEVTNAAIETGIHACSPGRPFWDVGRAIHYLIQRTSGYSACAMFTGHGIGKVFHRPPWIYHTLNEERETMLPDHCFTIEPCILQGSNSRVWIFPDGWTASTENCARSAQAELMILVTECGAEVLTQA